MSKQRKPLSRIEVDIFGKNPREIDISFYFADSKEPFSEREFKPNSKTRNVLENISNAIYEALTMFGEVDVEYTFKKNKSKS